ncbi:nucleotide sugar dehydrogenase [Pseudomonas sp. Z5-35]|uniref:nucleotide sugar dehydrogenase n=1 Tax=unclassified Pseudomonas TaxID=196821 RepID=UPI003DA7E68F
MDINGSRIAVIGLGYVGLPLAVEFGRLYPTLGFDINSRRVEQLLEGEDSNLEVPAMRLHESYNLMISSDVEELRNYNVYVVAVPTPAEEGKPNLKPLTTACELLGKVVKQGDVIIFESTVYPGVTEEECIPIVEYVSGLKLNSGFVVGYSPERINPGDKDRGLPKVTKLVSGSTVAAGKFIAELYSSIIPAGVHAVSSIRIAEAAKLVENVQRDVNVALINEFSMIFSRLGIDTEEVLKAAETKWNFVSYRPGLVGGHCIGVDSYYLAYKAQEVGHHPQVTLSSRRVNESMADHVVGELIRQMLYRQQTLHKARVLILGATFKENCPDLRNTKVINIIRKLEDSEIEVDVYDPRADKDEMLSLYDVTLISYPVIAVYDAVLIAVAHDEFRRFDECTIRSWGKSSCIIYDLKYILPKSCSDLRL